MYINNITIYQIIIFAACQVIHPAQHPLAYALLKVIRRFVECNMYASYDVHTKHTIEEYKHAQRQLGDALNVSVFNFLSRV